MSSTITVTRVGMRRASAAGAVGTVIEWYDYGLYATASALVITPLFFANLGAFVGQLAAFATFAIGFAARPLGGIVLGMLGDRIGRKKTLLLTVWIMGGTTFLVGCLPTAASIGVLAPILLVLLRLIQGFGAGGELAGAITYVSESTPAGRRGLQTSFSSAATAVGTFVSTATFAIVAAVASEGQLLSWAWRLPFLSSALLVVIAYVARNRLEDTPEFRALQQLAGDKPTEVRGVQHWPLWDMLRHDTKSFFAGLLAPTGLGVAAYVSTVFIVSYLVSVLGMDKSISLAVILCATATATITVPVFGLLTDRIGARTVFIFGAVFGAVFAFPLFALIQTKQVWLVIVAICAYYGVTWGATAGSQGLFLPSLFRTRYRYTGVATSRELNTAIFAGPAPLIATALVGGAGGQPWPVAWLLIASTMITIVGVALGSANRDDDVAEVREL